MKSVYLAGPITNTTYAGCTDWRAAARRGFAPGIVGLSPMRGKEYLAALPVIGPDLGQGYRVDHPMAPVLSGSRGIMTRDYFDCTGCDLVLANLLGATCVSIGTVMEMAWCYSTRTPLVIVMEEKGNPHEHPMVREAVGWRVTSLEDAIHVVNLVLGDYVNDPNALGRMRAALERDAEIG